MSKLFITAMAVTALMIGDVGFTSGAIAQDTGKKVGFDRDSGQGNLDNDNANANEGNEGQTSVSGPHGQVKQGNTDCNNCSQDLPGKNR
jgi:hypothetical protein